MRRIACLLAIMTAACSAPELPAPTGVQASQGTYANQIDISWNQVDGADSYRIFRFQTQTASYQQIGFIDAEYTATYNSVDSPPEFPIVSGEHYYYKVAAVDGDSVQGALSERAEGWSLILPAPSGLVASQGDYPDNIDLSWNAAVGAATYVIYRSDSASGDYISIGYVEAQYTATYNSTDSPEEFPIVPGQHYFYAVTSLNQDGVESAHSQTAEGWAGDFTVNLWWRKGSGVPSPGVLTSYDVDIDSSLQGTASFAYHEAGPRVETFTVTSGQFEDLYEIMLTHDMFRPSWSENPRPPSGGATESMSLTVDGDTFGPPTFPGSDEEISDKRAAMEAVRALVPEDLWD